MVDMLTEPGAGEEEVKAKFYVSGFHLLKNKFITLVRNKSSILHRYYEGGEGEGGAGEAREDETGAQLRLRGLGGG